MVPSISVHFPPSDSVRASGVGAGSGVASRASETRRRCECRAPQLLSAAAGVHGELDPGSASTFPCGSDPRAEGKRNAPGQEELLLTCCTGSPSDAVHAFLTRHSDKQEHPLSCLWARDCVPVVIAQHTRFFQTLLPVRRCYQDSLARCSISAHSLLLHRHRLKYMCNDPTYALQQRLPRLSAPAVPRRQARCQADLAAAAHAPGAHADAGAQRSDRHRETNTFCSQSSCL